MVWMAGGSPLPIAVAGMLDTVCPGASAWPAPDASTGVSTGGAGASGMTSGAGAGIISTAVAMVSSPVGRGAGAFTSDTSRTLPRPLLAGRLID